jgi:uncharacterized membrane protein
MNGGIIVQRNEKNLSSIIYTAMAIAMVTLATMVIRIPSPRGGYINFGDILIFTSAILIGKRTGFLAGGIGSALADVLSGYGAYAPATFIIKGIEGFICGAIVRKNNDGRINVPSLMIAAFLSASWMIFGYFAYEYMIMGIAGALPNVPGNIVQGAVSAVAVIPIVVTLKKTKLSFNR